MQITIKKLAGGECVLEVLPSTSILEIKKLIAKKLDTPVEEQKLLLLGRTLVDEQLVQSYPSIKNGTKIHLIVKKPEGLQEASLKYFRKLGMSDLEAVNRSNRLLKIVQDKFNKLSWDDIERLSMDCLLDETGQTRPAPAGDSENDHEDAFNM